MSPLRNWLLRWAPVRVIEWAARRALRNVPGIGAIDELRVETAAGHIPRVTASLRIGAEQDAGEVSRSAALAIYERLPPVELRILIANPPPEDRGEVVPLAPL